MSRVFLRTDASPTHCPYCRDSLGDRSKIVACAPCGARHHRECYDQHGRCATCDASDRLVPERVAVRVARPVREEPLPGSTVTLTRRGDVREYSWPGLSHKEAFVGLILLLPIVTAPLGLWILHAWATGKTRRLRVGPHWVEFDAARRDGVAKAMVVHRDEVGTIRVVDVQGAPQIAVDRGLERWYVKLGFLSPLSALEPPEVEWLAQVLQAWKAAT